MSYAILTHDNKGIHSVRFEDLPDGSQNYAAFGVAPVNETVPEGKARVGWVLVDGVACGVFEDVVPYIETELEIWEEKLSGYLTVGGFDLKASIQARDAFIGMLTLIREGMEIGAITSDTQMRIWDFHENSHVLTVAQIKVILFQYGLAWQEMFEEFAP